MAYPPESRVQEADAPQRKRASQAEGSPETTPSPDFATFFAVSLDLLVIRDSAFRIIRVNPAWEAALGYKLEELEGQPMLSFIHPDDVQVSHAEMLRVKKDPEVKGFINRYRRKDGTYRHLEWRAKRDGDLVYGVARDVTERLAAEAEMAAARMAAKAANKAKSDFLANMSHEVRTPLNGVIGVAAALAQTPLSQPQREMVDLILTSGTTLERVVSDLLDVSKIEAGKLDIETQPFDLRLELDGLLDMYRLRADEKALAFRVTYGPGAQGAFLGDCVRIKQVMGNLISNAIKFTAKGEVCAAIDVHEASGGQPCALALQVTDTGVGFDEDFTGKLFQRFSQADESITRRFGGTGLGLSICRSLVDMMGGDIEATSAPGRGSCFRVTMPLPRCQPAQAGEAARRMTRLEAVRGGGFKVLLAEDHEINRRVVELILAPAGAILTTVENGAEALSAYMANGFDLVLMDMQMPVMDGLAATRAIRAFEREASGRPHTPIIMLSANAMREHREDARAAGADLHLAKPVTAASLLDRVYEALDPARAQPDED